MKVKTLSLWLSVFISSPTLASGMLDVSNIWVGAGLGAGQLDLSSPQADSSSRAFSGKLDAGYQLNSSFGLYLGYDFMQYLPEDKDIHLGSIGLNGRNSLTENLDLVGKIGVAYPFDERSSNNLSNTFGLGLEYQLNHAVSTRLGVDYYHDLSLRQEGQADLYQAYWGLSYRFGQSEPQTVIEEILPVEVVKEVVKEVVYTRIVTEKLFAFGSSELTAPSWLHNLIEELKANPALTLFVEGHTDNTGSEAFNQKLSEQRAMSVAKYFIDHGIDAARISTIGKGEQDPVASNNTDIGRAQNRRVVLFVN